MKAKVFKTIKANWPKIKERIESAIKFLIMTLVMLAGFWIIYIFAWDALGFPLNNKAMWVLFFQALISEWLYVKWLSN